MTAEWKVTTIGDLCEVFDGPHATPKKTAAGPVFLGISSLNKGRINLSESEHLSESDYKKWTRRVTPQPGDVVFSYETRLGEAALIPEGLRCCLGRRTGLLRPRNGEVDSRFLLYYYLGPEFQEVIRQRTIHGSTVERIALIEFPHFPVRIPSLADQKAIAAVLGALDDKIELNRRMNATLEAMARALFQSWFVDFDPVRAKLDGRQPTGLDSPTTALFPNEFEESELGLIPKGWDVEMIRQIGDVICGKTPSTAVPEYYGADVPFITIPDMHGNVFAASTARKLSDRGAQSQANKTLPAGSICVSCIATPGLVVITSEKSQTNQQINSLVPHQSGETYFWYWVMTTLGAEIASSGSGGSVLTNLSKGRFETIRVIKPPHALIAAFNETVRPQFENILANMHESRTLAAMRDTLLPKLLSGQVHLRKT
jgi:type I restriction enzyme, S subunit